jgi:hypothetical protein
MPKSSSARALTGVTVVPDPSRRLSDGVLVEACIRARLLGVPVLKVEATIALAPAGLTSPVAGSRGKRLRRKKLLAPRRQRHQDRRVVPVPSRSSGRS